MRWPFKPRRIRHPTRISLHTRRLSKPRQPPAEPSIRRGESVRRERVTPPLLCIAKRRLRSIFGRIGHWQMIAACTDECYLLISVWLICSIPQ